MGVQAVLFIIGFTIILSLFILFIRFLSQRLNDTIPQHTFDRVERILIGGIIVGVVGMFQPWVFFGYRYGFLLLLISTLAFIVWSHVTPAAPLYGDEEFVDTPAEEMVGSRE